MYMTTLRKQVAILWFKKDLRLHDHLPLCRALENHPLVLPVYVHEPEYWSLPDASWRHWHFTYDCLKTLHEKLSQKGQGLAYFSGDVLSVLTHLQTHFDISAVYAHEETGNDWTYRRDRTVRAWAKAQQIPFYEYPTNGVQRPLKTRDIWAKTRDQRMQDQILCPPISIPFVTNAFSFSDCPKPYKPKGMSLQKGGRSDGVNLLKQFIEHQSRSYLFHISKPSASTYASRLSPHLTYGTLSMKEVVQYTEQKIKTLSDPSHKRGLGAFLSRLAWHCHFIQKLEDQPDIEFQCIHPAFEQLDRTHNIEWLEKWLKGETGYPYIDASMRCLNQTGWLTFRQRAMVVSFASYHLWLDWRLTAPALAQLFTDYEPGIHYSQIQMQSGTTGINAMRVYNPIKQSMDHDNQGIFIKTYVPQLMHLPPTLIHTPWKMTKDQQANYGCNLGEDYPYPLVDHELSSKQAKDKIAAIHRTDQFRTISQKVFTKHGSRKRSEQRKKKNANQPSFFKQWETV